MKMKMKMKMKMNEIKNFYKADIYRFNIETINNIMQFEISNVISWDSITMKMTKDELKGLADFINKHLENFEK